MSKRGREQSSSSRAPCKLIDFGRKSHVSARGLAGILRQVRDEGIPECISRSTIMRERQRAVYKNTCYGPIIVHVDAVTADGGTVKIPIQNPAAALADAVQEEEFANILRCAWPANGSDKFNIALYSDEVTPNDPLKTTAKRMQAFYWTFLEVGPDALVNEDVWFTLTAVRTDDVDTLESGFSQLAMLCVRSFFGLINGCFDVGVALELHGDSGKRIALAKLDMFLGDERALKATCACKGSAGLRLCVLDRNIVHFDSDYLPDPTNYNVPSTCLDRSLIIPNTDANVRATLARLATASADVSYGAKTRLKKLQTHLGFNHVRYNVFTEPRLNIGLVSTVVYDWMHVYFTTGIFDGEVAQFLNIMNKHGDATVSMNALHEYLQKWTWPKAYAPAKNVLCKGRLDGTASMYLSLSPVLAHWVRAINRSGRMSRWQLQIDSLLALSDVVDELMLSMRGASSPDAIDNKIMAHLASQQRAYGTELWKWKNHAATHLGDMFRKHGVLVPCFLHEKKHQVLLRHALPRLTLTQFSTGVLEEVTLQQMHNVRRLKIQLPDLVDPRSSYYTHTHVFTYIYLAHPMYPRILYIYIFMYTHTCPPPPSRFSLPSSSSFSSPPFSSSSSSIFLPFFLFCFLLVLLLLLLPLHLLLLILLIPPPRPPLL